MADENAVEEEAAPKKSKALLFAIVGIVVGVLAGGGIGFVLLANRDAPAVQDETSEADAAAQEGSEEGSIEGALEAEFDHSAAAAPAEGDGGLGTTFKLEPFIVNISDRERDRYLKLKTELELSSPNVSDQIGKRLPQVRDVIITLLSSKSFEEIRTIEGKNFLREELVVRLNALLAPGSVRRVFFTDFVVQ